MACKDCAMGALHEGTPQGKETTLYGLKTYVTEPQDQTPIKGHIVILTDALGWTFNNTRILADKYANKTHARVYIPEFFNGRAMPVSIFGSMDTLTGNGSMLGKITPFVHVVSGFVPFLFYNRQAVTTPRVFKWFQDFRAAQSDNLPVGTAGFCWGGKYVFLLANSDAHKTSDGKPLVDCGFTAHPSNLVMPVDAKNIRTPVSVAVGDVDILLPVDKVEQMKRVLMEEKKEGGHEVVVIPGARHGFAIRAHPDDKAAVKQGLQAEEQAIDWFNRMFAKSG